MSPLTAVAAPNAVGGMPLITQLRVRLAPTPVQAAGFGDILAAGVRQVESKVTAADDLVRRFALDDSVPVHQVTFALEEARLSVELAMQIRAKLVESYRELMNMQL